MTLTQQYDAARDPALLKKIEEALVNAAIAISSEGAAVQFHQLRLTFAAQVLNAPAVLAQRVAAGVVADGSTDNSASDAVIQTRVNAIWNAYAGAVA